MTNPISRRMALTGAGTVGIGALLAACAGSGGQQGTATTTAQVPTTTGGTATIEPQTSSGAATGDLFADAGSCTLTRTLTEGPYYFDVDSIRSDIREDREGVPLRLAVRVQDGGAGCAPLANAVVDIWHCDAAGSYSGFESASAGAAGGPGGGGGRTDTETYLRGAQVTNADGIVQFLTVYPGWYRGRTVHIHAKVHLDNATMLTTQLFFDEAVTEAVYAQQPYAQHTGRDRFNDGDPIFDASLLLTLKPDGDGYVGAITFVVDPA